MLVFVLAVVTALAPEKPNVLYLLADDMRAEWNAYGLPTHTPNFDRLAQEGLLFKRAYCQVSVCAPSRMSFMSSRRPDTYKVWNFIDTVPTTVTSLPRHFRDNGYLTIGLGKLFHQDLGAWNEENVWTPPSEGGLPYFPYGVGHCPHGGQGGGHCVQKDEEIYDYRLMLNASNALRYAIQKFKSTGQPFFVGTGFRKPHAPWQAPQRMYDLYNQSAIATAAFDTFPSNSPLIAYTKALSVQLENGTRFDYDPTHAVPKWVQQDQRHAYYASLSYVDENIGKILAVLDDEGVTNSTIVVFHADHGYHLGEHGEWEKKSNFDLVVRVPMVIKVPWKPGGKTTMALTELVDVFPTVSALAGLPAPKGVDGQDMSALLDDPSKSPKSAVFHQYPACDVKSFNHTRSQCNNVAKNKFTFMGYSVRTDEWRYTLWLKWDGRKLAPQWDGDSAEELYSHKGDDSSNTDNYENHNEASANPQVAQTLRKQLTAFFKLH